MAPASISRTHTRQSAKRKTLTWAPVGSPGRAARSGLSCSKSQLSQHGQHFHWPVPQALPTVQHLVLVDAALPDLDVLLAHLPAHTRAHLIHDQAPALAQMAEAAAGYRQLQGLHPIGHGQPERMALGGQWVDAQTLADSLEALAGLSAALGGDAHIWLYGCHSAQGLAGAQWLEAWALATGAAVHGAAWAMGVPMAVLAWAGIWGGLRLCLTCRLWPTRWRRSGSAVAGNINWGSTLNPHRALPLTPHGTQVRSST